MNGTLWGTDTAGDLQGETGLQWGGSPDSADEWGTLTSQNLFLYVSLHENQITEGDRSVQRSLVFILLVYIRSLVFKVVSHLLFHFPL